MRNAASKIVRLIVLGNIVAQKYRINENMKSSLEITQDLWNLKVTKWQQTKIYKLNECFSWFMDVFNG